MIDAIGLDHTVAGALGAAIDAEDAHGLGHRLQLLLVDIEVRIDVLYVVMLLERFVEPEHAAGVLAFELNKVLGNESDGGVVVGEVVGFESLDNGPVSFWRGEDLPMIAVVAEVIGARVKDNAHELVFTGLVGRDEDLSLALEHPGDAALFAHVAAILGEDVADLADRAVAV